MIMTRNLGYLELNGMEAGEPEPPADSFFFRVFNSNLVIAQKVLNTNFLQGIKACNLPPTNFGVLNVLDAYYCYHAADTYLSLLSVIDREKEPELYALAKRNSDGYASYNKTFVDIWHIPMASSIIPTKNFEDYAEHEHRIVCAYPPIYTLIAMLPCYYLWYWFSSKLIVDMRPDNIYRSWVEGSLSANSAYRIGNFIENWKKSGKEFNEPLAADIYKKSMEFELKVFTDAGNKLIYFLSRGGI